MKVLNAILFSGLLLAVAGFIGFKMYKHDIMPNQDIQACVQEFKSAMTRPLSFQRKWGTTEWKEIGMNNVTFEYNAKNGFGNDIPGRIECWVKDGKIIELKSFG